MRQLGTWAPRPPYVTRGGRLRLSDAPGFLGEAVEEAGDGLRALEGGAAGEADIDGGDVGRFDREARAVVAAQGEGGDQADAEPLAGIGEQQRDAGDVDRREWPQAEAAEQLVEDAPPLAAATEAQQRLAAEPVANGLLRLRLGRDPEELLAAQ